MLAHTDTVMNEGVEEKEYQDEMREEPLSQGWVPTGMAPYIPFAVDGAEEVQRSQKSVDQPRNPRGQSPSRDVVAAAPEVAEGNCTDSMASVP
jgi:hypothetical protein